MTNPTLPPTPSTIANLPTVGAVTSADFIPLSQNGVTYKATIGSITSVPGGTSGQIQYNNSGVLGGFTASGDATVNTTTGAITVTKTNGVAFGTLATLNAAPAGTLTGTTLASNVVTSSLTSVGALASGSLAAGFTLVSPALGGTGVANGTSTITLGGNLALSGAFTTTLTVTNTTALTLPITGTLSTLAGAETLTNKTIFVNTSSTQGTSPAFLEINGGAGRPINTTTSGTGSSNQISFSNGNGQIGSISTNASTTTYNTSSDYRLKENVSIITDALDIVAKLKPCNFTWKVDGTSAQGFLAHEVQSIIPICVTGGKDAVDDKGKPVYQSMDASLMIPVIVAAIHELQEKLTKLGG